MRFTRLLPLVAVVFASASAFAQRSVVPLPFAPGATEAGLPGVRCVPDHDAIHALGSPGAPGTRGAREHVTFVGFPLPGGGTLDLDLDRVDIESHRFHFLVDDIDRPDLLDGLDLSVWTGVVHGLPGSHVVLGLSHYGVRGWVHTGEELVHVLPRPSSRGEWLTSDVLVVTEDALLLSGAHFDFACGQEQASPTPPQARAWPSLSQQNLVAPDCTLREAKVALTTDFALYQRFNNLSAETAYLTTMFAVIADQYELQANTVMTFPYVAFYTTAADPWTATTSGAALDELGAAWGTSIPNGGRVGQLVSGAGLGGGVGYLSALCGLALSVAGNLAGNTPIPLVQGPSNWDFIVCAHEIGHNFGAIHTHEFCPPVDQCPPAQYFGACQTAQVCTNQGTIMSYCHLCSGGTSNVIPVFHANSEMQMRNEAGCLPYYVRVIGDHPITFAADVPPVLNATVIGASNGLVRVYYRYYGGPFTLLVMTNTGSNMYSATLPPPTCDATPQFYYSVAGTCAPSTDPVTAPTSFYTAAVGASANVLVDNFQTDTGWAASVQGATAGGWQRGVPVNDPNSTFVPPADFDGSGQCWLTGNAVGNSDVDNGSVILTSPALDLAGSGQTIEYAYWLRLQNSNGVDRMLIEISTNGTNGPWTAIATHTTDGSTWRTNVINATDLAAASVTPTANSRVRVTVNDGNPQGTVEAAFDAFRATKVSCSGTATSFCRGDGSGTACPCSNSGTSGRGCASSVFSSGGALLATGSRSVANDTVLLSAHTLTGSTCVFFQGDAQMAAVPVDDGLGCVTGSVVRLGTKVVSTNASDYPQGGDLAVSVRGAIPPVGGTRYYQCFYRNAAAGFCTPATSNRTNGVAITWVP